MSFSYLFFVFVIRRILLKIIYIDIHIHLLNGQAFLFAEYFQKHVSDVH